MIVGNSTSAGTIYFDTAFDNKSYNKNINNTLKSTENAFSKTFKKIGGIVGKALAITAVAKFTKSCLDLGSDLQEVQNVVDVSFPKMSKQVNAFSKNAITQFGLSEKMAKQYMGTFGAMSKSFGFSEESAYEMSKTITGLVGDVASFYNISQDLASVKLKAIWTGETEGLKDLGVVMTQTALEEYALQKGMGKTISEMSEAEKVALRYYFVQDKLAGAMGDFTRTSDGWANQTRVLSLRFEQLKATLGQGFITLFTPIIKGINVVLAGLQKVADVFSSVVSKIFGKQSETVNNISTEYSSLGSNALEAADDIVSASKKSQKAVMGYDKLNILSNKKDSGSSSGKNTSSSIPNIASTTTSINLEDNVSPNIDKITDKITGVFGKIKAKAIDIWNSDAIQSFVNAGKTGFDFLYKTVKTVGGNLVSDMSNTWNNIKGSLSNSLSDMEYLWTSFWQTTQQTIETWGQPIIDGVSTIFNSIWFDAIDPAIQLISQAWSDFSAILVNLWNEHGISLLNNIGEFCSKTVELYHSIWDNVISPIIQPFLEQLSWLWDEHLKGMIKNVGEFIAELTNGALQIYNQFVQPIAKWLLKILAPAWSFLSSSAIGYLGSLLGFISDIVSSIMRVLTGLNKFITGVFTNDWRKSWLGIKDIFKGIFDSLITIVKTPLNYVIDAINAMISGINKVNFKVPDWVPVLGGEHVGLNIPKIPKLAEGAWFKARNPRLAIIGEGKENEIVAPESKIEDAVERGNRKNNNSDGIAKLEITIIHKYPNGEMMIDEINETQVKAGKILLNV